MTIKAKDLEKYTLAEAAQVCGAFVRNTAEHSPSDKRSAFNAWLDAEFYGINLTDHQINAMEAAFTAGASLPSKNGGQLGGGANGLRWFLETFVKALDMHNGHGTPTLQRAEAYALEAEAKLMLAGHSAPSARMPTLSEYTIEQLRQLRAGVDLELQARVLGNPIGGVVDGRSDGKDHA